MAGIYIHIPFCRQKCHYCNFHFSVSLKNKGKFIRALLKEIELQHDFLGINLIDTLYFGGGTPSVLTPNELDIIVDKIRKHFDFADDIEFTLEANPDDLDEIYLPYLKNTGVNRLSVGIQSFFDEELKLMNRSHDAFQAREAIRMIKNTGFDDYSIDLIFGMPGSSVESWKQNLDEAMKCGAPHFSLYNLTVEPRTALEHMISKGKVQGLKEEHMTEQFLFTIEYMQKAGYEHYEISNYALPGRYAKHNTAYWQGAPYLGLGPSAHSFKGDSRQWNIANNSRYFKSIDEGIVPFEQEDLGLSERYNEYVMTGMRTMWGVNANHIREFGQTYKDHFLKMVKTEIGKGRVVKNGETYLLTREGKLFADEIASNLFI